MAGKIKPKKLRVGDIVWASSYTPKGLNIPPMKSVITASLVKKDHEHAIENGNAKPLYVVPVVNFHGEDRVAWAAGVRIPSRDIARTEAEARRQYNNRIREAIRCYEKEIESLKAKLFEEGEE